MEELRRGIAAARQGRTGEARAAFRAALRREPDNEAALLWLGYLAADPRAGLVYIRRAVGAHPRSPHARAALRWARKRVAAAETAAQAKERRRIPPQPDPPRPQRTARRAVVWVAAPALLLVLLLLAGWTFGLFSRLGLPQVVALGLVSSNSSPAATAAPATDTVAPTVTAQLPTTTPSLVGAADPPVPKPDPSPTPTPTPLPPTPTHTPLPPTPTATPLPTATSTPLPPPPTPLPPTPIPTAVPPPTAAEGRWIDIDLTRQLLTAYEGSTPVRSVFVSTGLAWTPTPVGRFYVYVRYVYDDMSGPGYYLPNVPYVMYFYAGYALHGTYWHSNFGQPMSHGCVNLPTPEAEWLFNWSQVGTLVNIHY